MGRSLLQLVAKGPHDLRHALLILEAALSPVNVEGILEDGAGAQRAAGAFRLFLLGRDKLCYVIRPGVLGGVADVLLCLGGGTLQAGVQTLGTLLLEDPPPLRPQLEAIPLDQIVLHFGHFYDGKPPGSGGVPEDLLFVCCHHKETAPGHGADVLGVHDPVTVPIQGQKGL